MPRLNIRIAFVLLSLVLAWLTYRFVERPIRHGVFVKFKVVTLLFLLTVIGCIGYNIYEKNGLKLRPIAKNNDVFNYTSHWDGWERCNTTLLNTKKNCMILKKNSPIDMLVIGDSHAGHLASGIKSYLVGKNVNVAVMLSAGCFPSYPLKIDGKTYFNCSQTLLKKHLITELITNQ